MRSFEEVVCHWQLTPEEEHAVLTAIRGYLEGVPTDEVTTALLHGVLGATNGSSKIVRALNESIGYGATVAANVIQLATQAVIVPEVDLTHPPAPPPKIDQSQLPEDARARLAAEAAKMGMWSSVPMAKHEGADT